MFVLPFFTRFTPLLLILEPPKQSRHIHRHLDQEERLQINHPPVYFSTNKSIASYSQGLTRPSGQHGLFQARSGERRGQGGSPPLF
ncbi:hypothetical protein VTL71DRAFT_16528, partial [Oculimacula yallundae]